MYTPNGLESTGILITVFTIEILEQRSVKPRIIVTDFYICA